MLRAGLDLATHRKVFSGLRLEALIEPLPVLRHETLNSVLPPVAVILSEELLTESTCSKLLKIKPLLCSPLDAPHPEDT